MAEQSTKNREFLGAKTNKTQSAILALQTLAELIRDQSGVEGVRIRITEKGDNQ
ncbi:MAG: hypothetical protein IIV93_01350 [Clostridia bacterium]|nr:hypothetical protein [Clostridia bacterium]